MLSVCQHFKSKPFNSEGPYLINGDLYTAHALEHIKSKAVEFGIQIPECLNEELPISFKTEYSKYSYTTCAQFYALELPKGMKKTVREYILEDLFKNEDKIVFSASMMQENKLELKKYEVPNRDYIYTHYIDFKGIRFILNLHHLGGDLSLETDHIIIYLSEQSQFQRPYQFLLSTTKLELQCAENLKCFEQTKSHYDEISNSPEVLEMIQAVVSAYCQKKRLIVAPESFLNDWRLYWERTATAEELFDIERSSYIGIAKFFADFFPNTVLMYATSAYGLVDRFEHIKSYQLSASKTYCGDADTSKLTYMSSKELKEWSFKLTEQINQVVKDEGIDEVYMYLYKGYMKYLNLNNQWREPMQKHKLQSIRGDLSRMANIVAMMEYFDQEFFSDCVDA